MINHINIETAYTCPDSIWNTQEACLAYFNQACVYHKSQQRNDYWGIISLFGTYYIEDIQMFLLNMSFISRVKWTIFIFHEWRSHD